MFTGVRVPDCDFIDVMRVNESEFAFGDGEEAVTWTDTSHGVVNLERLERVDGGGVTRERMVEWNPPFREIIIIIIDLELVEIEFALKD
jgi:hypothetical protein